MTLRRSFLLLEVIVSLALLALLGVWLLKLQSSAVRQFREARLRADVTRRVEALLWEWSEGSVHVTLPATGEFSATLSWRREIEPVRVTSGVIVPKVTVVVSEARPHAPPCEVYRVGWLVPRVPPLAELP